MSAKILIVDDEPVQRRLLEAAVGKFGFEAVTAEGGQQALDMLAENAGRAPDVVVLDLMMPGIDGLEVLERMRAEGCDTPVIVQTARGGIDTAVAAMRAGAFDFVVKPVAPPRLKAALDNALKVERYEGRARKSRKPVQGGATFADIVTRSPAMQKVIAVARKAAASDIPILIEGESGTGKELIARAIRSGGSRRTKAFVTVNSGAIPDNLVESILFGHEKGAFTGATDKHTGKFVEADGGTLFLDEIGDLPLDVQVKLLRAVQEGEVDPVGARSSAKVDIRLISATHRNLFQRVKEGEFREDLFYRLNVFPIALPPLRERREDIPLLAQHFISRLASAARAGQEPVTGISAEALAMLSAYDWPGNIRQVENAVFRAMVLCDGPVLDVRDFPQIRAQVEGIDPEDGGAPKPAADGDRGGIAAVPTAAEAAPAAAPGEEESPTRHPARLQAMDARGEIRPLAEVESEMIRLAVDHYGGQMSEVARRLGIGRSTLYRKLRELGIEPREERGGRIESWPAEAPNTAGGVG